VHRLLVATFYALALCGCVSPEQIEKQQGAILLSLTPEHFRDTAAVKDDPLDTEAEISTRNGFVEKRGLLGITPDDNFLRIYVDKKTGKATFQVYQFISYISDHWHFYNSVNYQTPSGPAAGSLISISRDVSNCDVNTGCFYSEDIAFDVDEGLLRAIAKTYSPGAINPWLFKFGSKSGVEWKDGLTVAEISGALMAVDAYKAAHQLR